MRPSSILLVTLTVFLGGCDPLGLLHGEKDVLFSDSPTMIGTEPQEFAIGVEWRTSRRRR